jgi:hypothetical protein
MILKITDHVENGDNVITLIMLRTVLKVINMIMIIRVSR